MSTARQPVLRSCAAYVGTALTIVLTAACQDSSTFSTRTPPRPAAVATGHPPGQVAQYCSWVRPTMGGLKTRRDTVYIPRAELNPTGRVIHYYFRQLGVYPEVAWRADCVVPYTLGALRRMDR
jgi:hypothetical protein